MIEARGRQAAARPSEPSQPSVLEYRAYLGMAMATAAISIDLILPSFGRIRRDLGLGEASPETARLISIFFLGLAIGPIPFGLLADRVGRRVVMRVSVAVLMASAIGAAAAPTLGGMVLCRLVWGIGASGIRVVATAMVRDRFAGDHLAREMAFIWTVFILVPILAPLAGAGIIDVLPWRSTFLVCASFGAVIGAWGLRFPETLGASRRQPLHLRQVWVATRAIVTSRTALGYTLAMLPLFAVFSSYLGGSELIVSDVFHRSGQFPFVFGASALVMGLASHLAGRSVVRIGVHRLIVTALVGYVVMAVAAAAVALAADGRPGFWSFYVLFALVLAFHNVLFPNLNAAAMAPVGHVAATAAAVIVTVSTAFGAVVGQRINDAFDGTLNTFSVAFAGAGVIALALCGWAGFGQPRAVASAAEEAA